MVRYFIFFLVYLTSVFRPLNHNAAADDRIEIPMPALGRDSIVPFRRAYN
jgi:hypothetical protein